MKTQYAVLDPDWDKAAWERQLKNNKDILMPKLERQRGEMLSPDGRPNEDWWGSSSIED